MILRNFTLEEVESVRPALPAILVDVLYLYAAGYTYEDIAKMLRKPIGTVRSRMFRGRLLAGPLIRRYRRDHGQHPSQ